MAKVNSLLAQRFRRATEKLSKMTHLGERSSSGNLSSFAGVFRVVPLNEREEASLNELLNQYKNEEQETRDDLRQLSSLTAEVKAINNQAILLHGERIQKAQTILKNYRDGAFTAWLLVTYGNRQTPYNFLQYFELYSALPGTLHTKLDEMPRQAVYSLASRDGQFEQKLDIIQKYAGQPKQELLSLIRDTFPLSERDQRAQDLGEVAITSLKRLKVQLARGKFTPTAEQKNSLKRLLGEIRSMVEAAHE